MMTIAGLTAGIQWIETKGWDDILLRQKKLLEILRQGLSEIQGIEIVGAKNHSRFTGAVSIISDTIPLETIKDTLWTRYQIKGSHGFQCAPLGHEALGTSDYGTLRFSVGPLNTVDDVETLLVGLKGIVIG